MVNSDPAVAMPLQRSSGSLIQAKLTVSPPGDKYEQEADQIAEHVMSMPEPAAQRQAVKEEEEEPIQTKPLAGQITPFVQLQPEEEEEELQAKSKSGETPEVTPAISSGIQSLQGSGRPLSGTERSFFEPRFGRDFSQVRLHMDDPATAAAREMQARAFTIGSHVVFGSGQYRPETDGGRRLLTHELTHVLQQASLWQSIQRRSRVDEVEAFLEFWDTSTDAAQALDLLAGMKNTDFNNTIAGMISSHSIGGLIHRQESRAQVVRFLHILADKGVRENQCGNR